MTVKPRDLLDQALALQSGGGEANARLAIGRAYYAALHRVIEILPGEFKKDDDEGNTHAQVIAAVDRLSRSVTPGRQAAIQIARTLRQLRRSRVTADYKLQEDLPPNEMELSLGRSQRVFDLCADVERLRRAAPGQ
jgi:hypothetical protein